MSAKDGVLLHFSPATSLEAGYSLPVLLTRAAARADTTRSGEPSRSTTASHQPLRVSVEGFNLTGQACVIVALPGED